MNAEITAAIHHGIEFLHQSRAAQGQWCDFSLAPGLSDEWVTGYVGSMVAKIDHPFAWKMAFHAWQWLSQRQSEGGWGYNLLVPRDADSTIWALCLAQALGCDNWTTSRHALQWLQHHTQPDHGMTTYATEAPIRDFIQASKTTSLAGWTQSHICVTAAAAQLAPFRLSACDFLRTRQEADGRWASYWWCDDEYATSLAVEALARIDNLGDGDRIFQALQWGQRQVQANGAVVTMTCPQGSSFATALVLNLLTTMPFEDPCSDLALGVLGSEKRPQKYEISLAKGAGARSKDSRFEVVVRIVRWLLDHQRADGSWPSSATLRVPPPDVISPDTVQDWIISGKTEKAIALDHHSIFTTATVIKSLQQFSGAILPTLPIKTSGLKMAGGYKFGHWNWFLSNHCTSPIPYQPNDRADAHQTDQDAKSLTSLYSPLPPSIVHRD